MISAGLAVPSTPMELVRRLTEQAVTPGTFRTAFSTRALHAAQLMPVTLYCSINSPLCAHFIIFWRIASSSSIVSSRPARTSSTTQLCMWLASSSRLKAFSAAFAAAA